MNVSEVLEFVSVIIAAIMVLYVIAAFSYRLAKGKSFWPNFKKMLKLLVEAFLGVG